MAAARRRDWIELNQVLAEVERNMSSLDSGDSPSQASRKIKASREALQAFYTIATALDLSQLERAGKALELYLTKEIESAATEEAIAVFGFALNALTDAVQGAEEEEDPSSINVEEVLEILGASSFEPSAPPLFNAGEEPVKKSLSSDSVSSHAPEQERRIIEAREESPKVKLSDFSRLEQIISKLGGELSIQHGSDGSIGTFQLHFQAEPASLKQIETLLGSADPTAMFDPQLCKEDTRLDEVINTIKEFMMALAAGDVKGARVILMLLAKQQHQAGLYDQIGSITRELHDSLKDFVSSLDSALKGLVDDELAHSENRLERILKHTEKAANTTLDHVEAMQRRNRDDQVRIPQLKVLLGGFKVTGEPALARMAAIHDLLDELHKSAIETRDDLIKVLTAQDYQDLTGQVIKKIIQLLKDMEMRLIKVISTFGFKVEYLKKKSEKEAPEAVSKGAEEALHSQDDVDNLLEEFGF